MEFWLLMNFFAIDARAYLKNILKLSLLYARGKRPTVVLHPGMSTSQWVQTDAEIDFIFTFFTRF